MKAVMNRDRLKFSVFHHVIIGIERTTAPDSIRELHAFVAVVGSQSVIVTELE